MRERRVEKEPEYKKQQKFSAEHQDNVKRYEDTIKYIVSIREGLNRIVEEQTARRQQDHCHESGKRKRDNKTIIALAITAIVGLAGIILSHRDTTKALREARATADQQHADTLVAINKTNATIAAMQTQAEIMRGQVDEMHTERRAWVTADIQIVEAVDYNVNGTHIGLLFNIRNIGKTPAIAVFPHLRANPFMEDMEPAQREQCANRAFGGINVFPGDQRLLPISTDIPKEETDKFWEKYPTLRPMIFPTLFACIVYRMPGEGTEHHTPFNFKLVRKHSDVEGRAASAIFVDEGRVPVERPGDSRWRVDDAPGFTFPQITTGDLDIPIIGQLPAANFPLSDEFEPRPVNVITFDAPFWRRGLWKQDLEHAPGNAHHALIFADADASGALKSRSPDKAV